jgi:hypothetical protein
MKMSLKFDRAAVASLGMLVLTVSARAQVISWNMDVNSTITGGNQFAGIVMEPYWNNTELMIGNATGDPVISSNLVDNSGTATGLMVAQNSSQNPWDYWAINFTTPAQDADGTFNRRLLNGYQNKGATEAPYTSSITISAIPYSTYDLYVYFSSDNAGRDGSVTDGSTTYYFSTLGQAETAGVNALFAQTTETSSANHPGADYAVFSGLTANLETIDVTVPEYGGIAGFQIVAVPEPASLVFAAAGLCLLLANRFANSGKNGEKR